MVILTHSLLLSVDSSDDSGSDILLEEVSIAP